MKFFKALRKVAAISFDLDDTLYDNAPVIGAAEAWFAAYLTERYQLPCSCREVSFWAEHKKLTAARCPSLNNDVTLLRAQALVDTFARLKQPLAGGMAEAQQLVTQFIARRSQIKVDAAVSALLRDLSARFTLCAISNGNVQAPKQALAAYFAFDLRPSIALGRARKPYPDLYLEAASRLKLPPAAILHVGDEPLTDVEGALRAGCQCAWLRGGIAGRSAGAAMLRSVPTLQLDSIFELRKLLQLPK